MRSASSPAALLLAVGALLAWPDRALASACCGEAALGDRLLDGEVVMSAVRVGVRPRFGSFSADAVYTTTEAVDVTTELSITTIARIAEPLELGATLPFVVNARGARGVDDEVDAGLGDVTAFATFTVLRPFEDRFAPGLAFTASATLPTGAPPEASRTPLASDVFGEGRGRLGLGVAVDKILGEHVAVRTDVAVFAHLVPGLAPAEERAAPTFLVSAGAGPVVSPVAAVGGLAFEGDVEPSLRRRLDVFVTGVVDVARGVAITADLRSPLPIDVISQADRAVLRATAGVRLGAFE